MRIASKRVAGRIGAVSRELARVNLAGAEDGKGAEHGREQ